MAVGTMPCWMRQTAGVFSLMVLLASAEISKQGVENEWRDSADTKFIAGVPVLNYHLGAAGESRDTEETWMVMAKLGATDTQIMEMCRVAKNGCKLSGSLEPSFEMRETERDIEAIIGSGRGAVEFVELATDVQDIPELMAESTGAGPWGAVSSGILIYHGVALFLYAVLVLFVMAEQVPRGIEQLDGDTPVLPARLTIVNICGLWVMTAGIVNIAMGLTHCSCMKDAYWRRVFILLMWLTHSAEYALKLRTGRHLFSNANLINGQFILLLLVAGISVE